MKMKNRLVLGVSLMVLSELHSNDVLSANKYVFDVRGNLVSYENENKNCHGCNIESHYEYDDKGNVIKIYGISAGNEAFDFSLSYTNTYRENGTLASSTYSGTGGASIPDPYMAQAKVGFRWANYSVDRTFDEHGNLILDTTGNGYWVAEYDENDNLISHKRQSGDGKVEYNYDETGKYVSELFSYDENGIMQSMKEHTPWGSLTDADFEQLDYYSTYDSSGNESRYDRDNRLLEIYDADKNLLKKYTYNSDGSYTILENGKTVKYNADGLAILPKRIYTVSEAKEALGKNNKNTFSIKYQ